MFEIPDDDDLFNEDSLVWEADISEASTSKQSSTSSVLHNPGKKQEQLNKKRHDSTSSSPQRKKSRILSEVNPFGETLPGLGASPHVQQNLAPNHSRILTDRSASKNISALSENAAGFSRVADSSEAAPRRRSQRCFPGPAGILPLAKPSELASGLGSDIAACSSEDERLASAAKIPSSPPSSGDVFGGAAWQALLADLTPPAADVLQKFSVRAMLLLHKARRRFQPNARVPLLLCVIDSMEIRGNTAGVVVRDPTGQVEGTLHQDVLRDFAADIQVGAAIVLRQVGVVHPSQSSHTRYLNITTPNIAVIYPVHSGGQPVMPASLEPKSAATQLTQDTVRNHIQAAETEVLEASNAVRENILVSAKSQSGVGVFQSPAGAGTSLHTHRFNNRQGGTGLFCTTPVQTFGSRGPFTPNQRLPGTAAQTTPGSRFTFRGRNVTSPMTPSTQTGTRNSIPGTPNTVQPWNKQVMSHSSATVSPASSSSVTRPWGANPQSSANALSSSCATPLRISGNICPTSSPSVSSQNNGQIPVTPQTRPIQASQSSGGNIRHDLTSPPQSDTPQSRWSFKRRTLPSTPSRDASSTFTQQTAGLESAFPQGVPKCVGNKTTMTYSATSVSSAVNCEGGNSGESSSQRATAPGTRPNIAVCEQSSAVRQSPASASCSSAAPDRNKSMWSDELSDDILSQLSDDF